MSTIDRIDFEISVHRKNERLDSFTSAVSAAPSWLQHLMYPPKIIIDRQSRRKKLYGGFWSLKWRRWRGIYTVVVWDKTTLVNSDHQPQFRKIRWQVTVAAFRLRYSITEEWPRSEDKIGGVTNSKGRAICSEPHQPHRQLVSVMSRRPMRIRTAEEISNEMEQLRSSSLHLNATIQELKLEISYYQGQAKISEWEKNVLRQDVGKMTALFKGWLDELQNSNKRSVVDDSDYFTNLVKYPTRNISTALQMSDTKMLLTTCQAPFYIEVPIFLGNFSPSHIIKADRSHCIISLIVWHVMTWHNITYKGISEMRWVWMKSDKILSSFLSSMWLLRKSHLLLLFLLLIWMANTPDPPSSPFFGVWNFIIMFVFSSSYTIHSNSFRH